jgi:membrane fusion protein, heavy metal efflux system
MIRMLIPIGLRWPSIDRLHAPRTARRFEMGLWLMLLSALLAGGCSQGISKNTSESGPTEESPAGPVPNTAAGEAVEESDLDRPMEDLVAASCEHGILQYTCDECRYEVGAVKVDPSLVTPDGLLDTIRVERRPVYSGKDLQGEVRLDGERSAAISPRAAGTIRAVRVDLGSVVRPGEIIFEIESTEFAEARAAYARARAGRRLTEATADREADLFAKRICPEKDLIEARAALASAIADQDAAVERLIALGLSRADIRALETEGEGGRAPATVLPVTAPIAGRILERNLSVGETVAPGDKLLLIGETSRVWVVANVYERDLAALAGSAGSPIAAQVSVPAFPGRVFPGVVERVSGMFDETSRTTTARVVVDNPEFLLRPGMFASVRIFQPAGEPVPAVPEESILDDEGRAFTFVRAMPPYFFRRPVVTGRRWNGWVEITEGLTGGEVVVSRGAFLLKSDVLRSKMGAGCAD